MAELLVRPVCLLGESVHVLAKPYRLYRPNMPFGRGLQSKWARPTESWPSVLLACVGLNGPDRSVEGTSHSGPASSSTSRTCYLIRSKSAMGVSTPVQALQARLDAIGWPDRSLAHANAHPEGMSMQALAAGAHPEGLSTAGAHPEGLSTRVSAAVAPMCVWARPKMLWPSARVGRNTFGPFPLP